MSFSFLHGIHPPKRKHTEGKFPVVMHDVKLVTIPMAMHIGAPSTPIVKVGDLVKVGTKIAESNGKISVPVHSSVSGKVKAISDILLSNGKKGQAIVIESDGEMTVDESVAAPVVESKEDFVRAVLESGVVGLGGAGFPTHVKLDVAADAISELIINGAECEPYITSDTVTMTERSEDMAHAIREIKKYYDIKRIIIGLEAGNDAAIASMTAMAGELEGVEVKVLPARYPQGGEKVLVYHTTGKVIATGALPISVGCVVINCTTLATIGEYLKTGMPLVQKCVTVDGGAIKEPQNVIVPVGTSIADVFAFCGGLVEAPEKVIYGGPMMGVTVPNMGMPVMKNSNALLALTKKEAWLPKTTACIRCGACTNTCPFGLAPAQILSAYDRHDVEALKKLSVDTCMLCGCCSFTCPANRPLVQTNNLAKQLLKEERMKEANK